MGEVVKRCTKCQVVKPLDMFYRRTRSCDGHDSWCAKCKYENGAKHPRHRPMGVPWFEERKKSGKMRVLLTGASGLLGRYLLKHQPLGMDVYPTYYEHEMMGDAIQMDLADKASIYYAFNVSDPEIVIHCAGMASVDACNRYPKVSHQINVEGTKTLVAAATEYKSEVVYISTNAVFKGENPPYHEFSGQSPINEYGRQKLMAENYVKAYAASWLIVRPILLYGKPWSWGRGNWATRVQDAIRLGQGLSVVNDTMTQPTYAGACAQAIWTAIEAKHDRYLHIGGADKMSLYDFCLTAMDVLGQGAKIEIEPVPSSAFDDIEPRPRDTTYDLSQMIELGIEPMSVADGLERMREEYE